MHTRAAAAADPADRRGQQRTCGPPGGLAPGPTAAGHLAIGGSKAMLSLGGGEDLEDAGTVCLDIGGQKIDRSMKPSG